MARASGPLAEQSSNIAVDDARRALQAAIGIRIREVREQAGVGQRECARLAGVNSSTMFRIERGQQNISIEVLARISLVLSVDIEELLIGIRPDPGLLGSGPAD